MISPELGEDERSDLPGGEDLLLEGARKAEGGEIRGEGGSEDRLFSAVGADYGKLLVGGVGGHGRTSLVHTTGKNRFRDRRARRAAWEFLHPTTRRF